MTDAQQAPRGSNWTMLIITALSLSIGWGIRGNFGHEHGAMMPGALAAMAAVVLSGRQDWMRRVAYFGMFGAIGWGFGGSMSYMKVIAYTQCGSPPVMLYGFAMLFVIGFLWAAPGGAGTALPAFMPRKQLAELFAPAIAFFVVLAAHDLTYDQLNAWIAGLIGRHHLIPTYQFRIDEPLWWYDTDWTTALIAILVPLAFAAIRRKWDRGTSLVFTLGVGWFIGFLVFPVLLDIRMTSPRGDNWSGMVGLTIALWCWLQRNGLPGVTTASVIAGLVGGAGFAGAAALKLLEIDRGVETNWHSVLEQTYGLFNGIGIGLVMIYLMRRAPRVSDEPATNRWTDWFAPAFTFLFVLYLNARKNPEEWVKQEAMKDHLYWLQPITWYNIGFLALAAAIVWLLISHMRRPLDIIPRTWRGKGQLLYLCLLWALVMMNFERAVVGFVEQRLITEGVISINAIICTMMILLCAWRNREAPEETAIVWGAETKRVAIRGTAAIVVFIVACFGVSMASMHQIPESFKPRDIRFENPPKYLFAGEWIRKDTGERIVFIPGDQGYAQAGTGPVATTADGKLPENLASAATAPGAPPRRTFRWRLTRSAIVARFDGETSDRTWPWAVDNSAKILDIVTTGVRGGPWERYDRIGDSPQKL